MTDSLYQTAIKQRHTLDNSNGEPYFTVDGLLRKRIEAAVKERYKQWEAGLISTEEFLSYMLFLTKVK